MRILRPVFSWGEANWAHIDNEGASLCGEDMGADVELRLETVEDGTVPLCPRCRHAHNQYSVKVLSHGQARSYQDSQYIYNVVDLADEKRSKAEVLTYCRKHIRESYRRSEMPSWASPELREFSQTEPGVWRYHVREAYTG